MLDALGIVNGPVHAEIKWCRGAPCLVEAGSQYHGGEGTFIDIIMPCVGYNQVDVFLDSYLDAEKFDAIPSILECRSSQYFA